MGGAGYSILLSEDHSQCIQEVQAGPQDVDAVIFVIHLIITLLRIWTFSSSLSNISYHINTLIYLTILLRINTYIYFHNVYI